MRRKTAELLSSFSERVPGSRLGSLLRAVAWRALAAVAVLGDRNAVNAVWDAWLRHLDDRRWGLLSRCRDKGELAESVFAAVADPDATPGSRAALGAFCTSHGAVPAAPERRAMFYVLTGQHVEHRAADPDGTALAAAYRAAGEPTRAALRQAMMAGTGGLDLVRVIATRGGDSAHAVPETEAECQYLISELARNRDWPRLWLLALDLPLADAVTAARRLPAGWCPSDESGRLLDPLTSAQPDEIRALARLPVTRLDLGSRGWEPCTLDIAPDGSEMAITQPVIIVQPVIGGIAESSIGEIYTLPSGHRLASFTAKSLLHLGDALVYADHSGVHLVRHRQRPPTTLTMWDGETSRFPFADFEIARVPDGCLVARRRYDSSFPLTRARTQLRYWTPRSDTSLRVIRLPNFADGSIRNEGISQIVSEPGTGRVAVTVHRGNWQRCGIVILSPDFRVVAQLADFPRHQRLIGFCDPETLLTSEEPARFTDKSQADKPTVISWRVQEGTVSEKAAAPGPSTGLPLQLLPASRVLVSLGYGAEKLRCWDADTLQQVPCPAVLAWAQGRLAQGPMGYFTVSPDGRLAAVGWRPGRDSHVIEVRDLLWQEACNLLQRPLAQSRPGDLTAAAKLVSRFSDPKIVAALGLLRACLEYRFAHDVAIGDVPAAPAGWGGPDDIALSPESRS